ncbi:MAG TPA: hypothetical protein VKB57_14470 [Acidimicrobiales bacterium]|nr:hypothetical protein [Acidimicrobiales bacterium]
MGESGDGRPGEAPEAANAPGAGEAPEAANAPGAGEAPEAADRRLSRRQMLALGAGGVALVGGGIVIGRQLGDDGDAGRHKKKDRGEKPPKDRRDKRGKTDTTQPPANEDAAPPVAHSDDLPKARWSDPATWGGSVPGKGDVATVDKPVLLDVDAVVAGVRVAPRGDLVFDPAASRRLDSTGNVVVEGRLRMRPAAPQVRHGVRFLDVDESRFVGGHSHTPLATDVGLWVTGAGLLDAQGTRKTSWTRLTGAAERGDRTVTVAEAKGWRVGDEVVVTPTEPATVDEHWAHHDRTRITAIRGNRITLRDALEHPHPTVSPRPGVRFTAEVLNLTRNVVVEGTPEGRSHLMMLMTSQPQEVGYMSLRNMGPRKAGDEEVLGRYAIHFHADYDGSRGTLVEGVVAYDSTGHGFASHLSNGVTFRQCIAHNMVDDAFWWDLSLSGEGRDLVPSNNITYDRCVASCVRSGANSKFNLTGFLMGAGDGNVARGNVATGVQGGAESSTGFHWPSHSRNDKTWTFEDNLAHNNRHSGIYFWQNGVPRTIVDRFTAYHTERGIFAGSYSNLVSYRDCTIYGCEKVGLVISALPSREGRRTGETITYENMYIDQAGLSDYAVEITKHISRGASDRVTKVSGCTFKGGNKAQVGLPDGGDHPQRYDFVDCTFQGNAFWLATDVPPDTNLQVQGPTGNFAVRRSDQKGEDRPSWNAVVAEA